MATVLDCNKTKIARRVIEIFEYFANTGDQATVMDIVRRYGRPQSSTSELLASLVEMGLLYKDNQTRSYGPTPRLAALGAAVQPPVVRNGRLFGFMDRLAKASGCGVALFGSVGMHVQIFRWAHAGQQWAQPVGSGSAELLSSSSAGLLMLSTLGADQANRILWRLNAEAPEEERFNHAALRDAVAQIRMQRHVIGKSGFIEGGRMIATLLPTDDTECQVGLGVIHPSGMAIDPVRMLEQLNDGIAHCLAGERMDVEPVREMLKQAL